MNVSLESIEQAAMKLSVSERAALAHTVSNEHHKTEVDEAYVDSLWATEAEDRLDAYLRGEIESSTVDAVVAGIRKRLKTADRWE